jgi:hypothetical protein
MIDELSSSWNSKLSWLSIQFERLGIHCMLHKLASSEKLSYPVNMWAQQMQMSKLDMMSKT